MSAKDRRLYLVAVFVFFSAVSAMFVSRISEKQSAATLPMNATLQAAAPETYYYPSAFELPSALRTEEEKPTSSAGVTKKSETGSAISLPILMYHYVEPLSGKEDKLRIGLTTSPEILKKQIDMLLSDKYSFYQVKDAEAWIDNPRSLPSKPVILSFDDGYEDFYTYVFPILKQYHAKATLYVIYDAINAPGYVTESQIKEMASSGLVEIGSHTLDHAYLKNLPLEKARKQIILSKTLFEKRFRFPISTFAYPFGAFSQDSIALVKQAGYRLAVSVIPGSSQSEANRFLLFRIRPGSSTGKNLISKIQ